MGKYYHVRPGMCRHTRMRRRACFHEIAGFIVGKGLKNSTLTLRRFRAPRLSNMRNQWSSASGP